MPVYPYALLQADPTTEIGVSWIDDTGDGGDHQTIYYGTDESDLNLSESDSGESVISLPDSYVYHTKLDGLDPGTRYYIEIDSSETVQHTFETMPETMPDPLSFAATSDHHPWRDGVGMAEVGRGPDVMEELGGLNYDLILFPGDWLTHVQSGTTDDAEDWMTWWSDYGRPMDKDKLHPHFTVPGNHEVADNISQVWSGDPDDWDESDLTPDAGHYQQFFPNTKELSPDGESNYASVTISDYIQVIGLDTYSAFPADQTSWLEETIDESVDFCIPIIHAPLLPGGKRGEDEINRTIRQEWAKILYDADNVHFTVVGDNHTRKVSYPYSIVESEPSHDDYFDLGDDGYMVADEGFEDDLAVQEFGDGWPNNRPDPPTDGNGNIAEWYLEYVEREDVNEANFHTIQMSNSEKYIEVREWDQWGSLLKSHSVLGSRPTDPWTISSDSKLSINSEANLTFI